jgi:hypothetical protein
MPFREVLVRELLSVNKPAAVSRCRALTIANYLLVLCFTQVINQLRGCELH